MDLICINDTYTSDCLAFYKQFGVVVPKKDKLYSIRGTENVRGKVGIFLNEIVNPSVPIKSILSGTIHREPSFGSFRFTTLLGEPIKEEELQTIIEDEL